VAPDVFRLTVKGGSWNRNESSWQPFPDGTPEGKSRFSMRRVGKRPEFRWLDSRKRPLLQSESGHGFGICGEKFMMAFQLEGEEQFYGMGEKFLGLELSGTKTKFWNTDLMGDFPHECFAGARTDPAYASIPYLIVRTKAGWAGILVNNPGAVMMNTGAAMTIEGFQAAPGSKKMLLIGAEHGQPDLFFLFDTTLAGLTRKAQTLMGTTPLPPVWSLGYHQCRWGYASAKELAGYKRKFDQAEFPVDGLWLDIDYMDGYRVFTFNDEYFPDPKQNLAELQKYGQRVVPIIDPGVKVDPDWPVYRDGIQQDIFCKNPQGNPFVGVVWPGNTAFVDFPVKKAFRWWKDRVAELAATGIQGCWNDMNDPSLGFVENDDMLWEKGRKPHWTHHNQFALEMADATRQGFLKAHPDQRPFILSRSGSTGMAKVAAIWHGDSISNYPWLKRSIATCINLGLSGVPFNGPDLGGFAEDCPEQLLVDYIKACFLFPFCRNHSCTGTRRQEPWAYGQETFDLFRNYVRDRYRLRPYLYQLFVQQEELGDPVLRPLFYEASAKPLDPAAYHCDDQFMVGPAFLQAPLVSEQRSRKVLLPEGRWWNVSTGKWIEGGRTLKVTPKADTTPLYAKAGTAVPMEREEPTSHHWKGDAFDLHLFLEKGKKGSVKGELVTDDGNSFGYQRGERTRIAYTAKTDGTTLTITTRATEKGFGDVDLQFVLYGNFRSVTVNRKEVKPERHEYRLAGAVNKVWKVG
jgi:alpha-glucosidase